MTDLVSVRGLLGLAADSVRAPRPTFARLLALGIPRQVLWEALILVVVVSVILAELGNMILRATIGADGEAPQFLSPFAFGALQFVVLVTSALLIDRVGRAMGGTGDLAAALLAVTWLQFVMIVLQLIQSVLLLVLPGAAGIVLILGIVLFLYLLTAFVAELHGFVSMGRTFAMIFFVMMGVALALSFVLTLTGVAVPR